MAVLPNAVDQLPSSITEFLADSNGAILVSNNFLKFFLYIYFYHACVIWNNISFSCCCPLKIKEYLMVNYDMFVIHLSSQNSSRNVILFS